MGESRIQPFDTKKHTSLATKTFHDGYTGIQSVDAMVRFFQRGDDMEESKPFSFPFYYRQRVENGWFTEL